MAAILDSSCKFDIGLEKGLSSSTVAIYIAQID